MRDVPGALYADLIGKPFAWRGRGPAGFDCFGLVLEMFKRTGRELPNWDTPPEIAAVASAVALEFAAGNWHPVERKPGVMVRFGLPLKVAGSKVIATTHCGFMVTPTDVIHAWEQTGGVTTERLSDWTRRVAGYYDFKGTL